MCKIVHGRARLDTGVEGIRRDAGEIVVYVRLPASDGVDLTANGRVLLAVAMGAVQCDIADSHRVRDGVVLE